MIKVARAGMRRAAVVGECALPLCALQIGDGRPFASVGMNTAALRIGRLLEIRADAGYRSVADVEAIFAQIRGEIGKVPEGTRVVVVVDWRRCPIMSPDAAAHMATAMSQANDKVERSATITRDSAPSAVLQFLRVIRDTNHPDRQLFRNSRDLIRWLEQVLTPVESKRLRAFLAYQ